MVNATNFSSDGILGDLVHNVIQARGLLQLQNVQPAPCFTTIDATGWWWAQPGLIEIAYDFTSCSPSQCPFYNASSTICVATCVGCGARCQANSITSKVLLSWKMLVTTPRKLRQVIAGRSCRNGVSSMAVEVLT